MDPDASQARKLWMQCLPPEIWLGIFDHATVVPSELNSNAISIFERSTHLETQQAREITLPTRRALPLVCKTFHQLASEFLYKSIIIRRGARVGKLLETFRAAGDVGTTQDDGVEEPACRGRWTKRLDIDCSRRRCWNIIYHGELLLLLPFMPNLEILVILGAISNVDERLLAMSLQSCRNLKMSFLPNDLLPLYEDAIFQAVTSQPLTSTLRISYPSHPGGSLGCNGKPKSYHDCMQCYNLRAVTSSDAWMQTHAAYDASYFPHLRTLHVYGEVQIPFLETHGHKITTLDLELSAWNTTAPLMDYFPNLRDIVLDLESVLELACDFEICPQAIEDEHKSKLVRRLGLTVNAAQARHSCYTMVFKLLPVLFPKMEKLRILERNIVNTLCKQPGRARRWHEELRGKGVRLEREDGELLIYDCPGAREGLSIS